MTSRSQPNCYGCKHLLTDETCTAFPQGIPDAILDNEVDHRQPYPGDNGIRFDPQDEDAARYAAVMFGTEDGEDSTESEALAVYGCVEGVVVLPHTDGPPAEGTPIPSEPATRPKIPRRKQPPR